MNPNQLIEAFINVIQEQKYVFNEKAIQDIPSLQKNLAALKNHLDSESLLEIIQKWYINHQSVRDAVLATEREIPKIEKSKPASQENTLENQYRIIQDELPKLQDQNQQSNQQS